jgi:hypothetical protein
MSGPTPMQSMWIWRRFCELAGFPTTAWQDVSMDDTPSWSSGSVPVPSRCLFVIRSPEPAVVELVICEDGRTRVYPLTPDQHRLLVAQGLRALGL